MAPNKNLNRREFLGSAATVAASISIVPSNVIAGLGKNLQITNDIEANNLLTREYRKGWEI
ncbi:hypothetical protein [Algoriphagus aquimarinus]|uniref:hypothetical protein n=1 Tax=Algoriphagus aquimarinus TaxID=237018 RepID=UPI0030DBC71C|tara:strand:+ start:1921 stop:2103 length:183 start_codon:yes stop_codon:yes gene_type:complete